MHKLMYTLSINDYKRKFKEIKQDIELILDHEGYILAKNEYGEKYFDDSHCFYDYFIPYDAKRANCYIRQIILGESCPDLILFHKTERGTIYIQYRGAVSEEGYILLHGRPCAATPSQSAALAQFLPHFEHAYGIIDHQMRMVQSNKAFQDYCTDSFLNGEDSILNFADREDGLAVIPRLIRDVQKRKVALDLEVKNETQTEHWKLKAIYLQDTHSVLLMVYDLSPEKKYMHLLTYKDQMESVSYLSAGVAHELRNPLSVIKGFLQLSTLTDSFHKYSNTILSETERMNEIIDNFLSLARKKATKEFQSPQQLLSSVIDIIRSECLMQGVHFDYQVQPVTDQVEVNVSSFKQIILNVLRNAMESYPAQSRRKVFRLHSYKEDKQLIIQLSDNGEGIPAHVLENLGKPFYTTKDKGTGVGVPLCKKIMEEHNGTFDIKSQHRKGTIVTLTFPLM
ncbi:sensor histidine kinase [Bacillus piscicola]|uniref:sensor histidine kinase n=1 Tax=Bacillus piscicola TaxID=1632684 RepID=UPI001F09D66C|nr:HAMP domain-containing sensor histidine kinase [Bacillus piscicola]